MPNPAAADCSSARFRHLSAFGLGPQGGIAHERRFGDGFTRYELADDDAHHDHLICLECDTIIEFEEPAIEDIVREVYEHGLGASA